MVKLQRPIRLPQNHRRHHNSHVDKVIDLMGRGFDSPASARIVLDHVLHAIG